MRNDKTKKQASDLFPVNLAWTSPHRRTFDFTTAGDWDCVAAVERPPALHYSVDFIFLPFVIMGFFVELWNY